MKKQTIITVCLMLLCLLFFGTAAADGLEVNSEVAGICGGIDYVLPCFAADSEADDAINLWINGLAETGLAELFPQLMLAENGAQVKYSIARNDERYLCIVLEAETEEGLVGRRAVTFARDGVYAGQTITLAQVLGLESEAGTEEMDLVIRSLVWETIQREAENMDRGFLDGLTLEAVTAALYPQWDFRLDEDGNIVFMIQPGEIAAEMEGVLEYPFLPEELIDAMK